MMKDLTEQPEFEERQRHAQRMAALGQVASGVAHDFNNLLTVMAVETELLHEALGRDNPLNTGVEAIRKATERAAGLTRQLLSFSRKQTARPRLMDLNALVTETALMLERLIGEEIELATTLETPLPPILGDPSQLQLALMNLALNARDAMPQGGVLTIVTESASIGSDDPVLPAGEYVVIIVADTGHGMDDSVRQCIFKPFFTTKPPGRGTGLGLSTVLGIVEQTGGRIAVSSESGRGSRFTIHIPRANPEATEPEPNAFRALHRKRSTDGATVLLVEDEHSLRAAFKRALRKAGYSVLEAEDGIDALEVAKAFDGPIDVLVTNVVMPRLGARDLVAQLEASRPQLHILFMSGYSDEEIIRRGLLKDTTNFLQKPFSGSELVDAIRRDLRSSE
jgi:nitrogen-specific signal transduction histidine kinase/ActR/RegA family two-component response regulator